MRHLKATTAEASLKAAFVFDMVGARAAKMDRMVLPLLKPDASASVRFHDPGGLGVVEAQSGDGEAGGAGGGGLDASGEDVCQAVRASFSREFH